MRLDQVTPKTRSISSDYLNAMRGIQTLQGLRIHLRKWRDFAADALDVIATWDEATFDTYLQAMSFTSRIPGVTAITQGICDEVQYRDFVTVAAPELIGLLRFLGTRDKVPEGTSLKRLLASGTVRQVDGRWRVVIESLSPREEFEAHEPKSVLSQVAAIGRQAST